MSIKITPLEDVREIRKLLTQVAYRGSRVSDTKSPGNFDVSYTSPLVGRIFRLADHEGLSGEDKMTLLAYHTLLAWEACIDRSIVDWETRPVPPLMMSVPVREMPESSDGS